ncbi:AarF/UbiB family protein [Microbacterium elymi]|uniref:AarF/UbiB family protein n=1 Tax=Microbacterium elymi TaxID=2909587 RepID=A0ABY5NGK5_9MICO|nr:AarF/UbiB family protein [Microbacterium elymi]UUT34283.1 AarF/UbiB family protein [Microbacterium elymi]
MSALTIVLDVAVIVIATVVAMVVIGAFARRVLGIRVSIVRVVIAGILGLGAEVGFESQFVWGAYTPALIPVQFGIILFVAIAFLVLAEVAVPQGTLPRPDQWAAAMRRKPGAHPALCRALRIASHHRLLPFKINTEPTNAGAAERRRQAVALTAALEDAGGAFVKIGQLLSTRTDVLPVEFTEALGRLQQRVPPAPWEQIAPTLGASLGRPVSEVFADFREEAVAAASIGQVHEATLPSGQRVAVKVQRPGIVPLVERDIDIALRLSRRLAQSTGWARRFGLDELADSLAASLRDELDYRVEASNIAAMEAVQERRPKGERLRIPHFIAALSSRDVLVMEYLSGTTLSEGGAADRIPEAQAPGAGGATVPGHAGTDHGCRGVPRRSAPGQRDGHRRRRSRAAGLRVGRPTGLGGAAADHRRAAGVLARRCACVRRHPDHIRRAAGRPGRVHACAVRSASSCRGTSGPDRCWTPRPSPRSSASSARTDWRCRRS